MLAVSLFCLIMVTLVLFSFYLSKLTIYLKWIFLQQDAHVIGKAFHDRPVERAALSNKTGQVC